MPEPSPNDVQEASGIVQNYVAPGAQREPRLLTRKLSGSELEVFRRFDRAAAAKRLRLWDQPSLPASSFDGATFADALVFQFADDTWPRHGYSLALRRCSPHRWRVVDFGLVIE